MAELAVKLLLSMSILFLFTAFSLSKGSIASYIGIAFLAGMALFGIFQFIGLATRLAPKFLYLSMMKYSYYKLIFALWNLRFRGWLASFKKVEREVWFVVDVGDRMIPIRARNSEDLLKKLRKNYPKSFYNTLVP